MFWGDSFPIGVSLEVAAHKQGTQLRHMTLLAFLLQSSATQNHRCSTMLDPSNGHFSYFQSASRGLPCQHRQVHLILAQSNTTAAHSVAERPFSSLVMSINPPQGICQSFLNTGLLGRGYFTGQILQRTRSLQNPSLSGSQTSERGQSTSNSSQLKWSSKSRLKPFKGLTD